MGKDFDVICVGDATIDIFLPLSEDEKNLSIDSQTFSFKSGDKYLANGYKLSPGGIASNVSVGLSRLNKKVALVAEIGSDGLSDKIIQILGKEGVQTDFALRNPNKSPTLSVVLRHKGQHILFVAHVLKEHRFNLENLNASYLLLASLGEKWKEAYQNAINSARQKNMKIVFAPGDNQLQGGKESLIEFIAEADLIFLNKEEAQTLAGDINDLKSLLEQVKKMGPEVVVITDGLNGSYCLDEKLNAYHAGVVIVDAVETTGAGDAYTSGFLAAYISGESIENAMMWGVLNSASVVQKVGAQEGLLNSESLKAKLSESGLSVEKL